MSTELEAAISYIENTFSNGYLRVNHSSVFGDSLRLVLDAARQSIPVTAEEVAHIVSKIGMLSETEAGWITDALLAVFTITRKPTETEE